MEEEPKGQGTTWTEVRRTAQNRVLMKERRRWSMLLMEQRACASIK